ncbi:hypothetical protein M2459_002513 [Parabacteroides sp. PF5-5]|uniref:DUF3226 domain-containing protein n=1 Tax=unclassified Parabacteroides TaxID=2649774 RepID=UPI0024760B09|nr:MULTISPECIES: DUF3226 domain-containing protein [unclassified Parabacteroides]MDH6305731.1 hypothetical protein [Parabacteroides sp. PH5-39]MDH6316803.1 hypothetical protein [Parabacteroides sp. PF5-13]MDH6320444.1 hypothetical protein [Parabacteroides sp. PH5-13]MDH6324174.1 hypothetical protein [Parabacteroides sp. PH5-8]MDH6327989.1 hypothetical protein [Parabacteroides sp. PH5-41]
MKHTIYVEDKDRDRLFIEAYLHHLGISKEDVRVVSAKGYTRLFYETGILQNLEDTAQAGKKNIVIFDADYPENGGGFEERKQYLQKEAERIGKDIELFLFPNNKEDGDFETLLEQLVPEAHKGILSCFESYEKCLLKYNNPLYKIPDRKNKLHTYIYTFDKQDNEEEMRFKKQDYCYENPEYWDLNAEALLPLKTFLETHLS